MKNEEVKKLTPIERLLYWINERESIRLKKERGLPRPWTDDSILNTYRFCCVNRDDDRVSRWIIGKDWHGSHRNHPMSLVAAALARFFNFPSTLAVIAPHTWNYNLEEIRRIIKQRRTEGHQIFNGAYMVSTNGRSMDKVDHVLDLCVGPLSTKPWSNWIDVNSVRKSCENLQQCYGYSGFMSGQVVGDLRWALDGTWADRNVWASMGPGSKRGMNRLHNRPIEAHLSQKQFEKELTELISVYQRELPLSIRSRLAAISVQSTLCELDKYERTLWEGRRPKSLYTPYAGA